MEKWNYVYCQKITHWSFTPLTNRMCLIISHIWLLVNLFCTIVDAQSGYFTSGSPLHSYCFQWSVSGDPSDCSLNVTSGYIFVTNLIVSLFSIHLALWHSFILWMIKWWDLFYELSYYIYRHTITSTSVWNKLVPGMQTLLYYDDVTFADSNLCESCNVIKDS